MLDFMMDLSSHKVPKTSEGGVVTVSEAGSTHKCLHSELGKTAPQPPQHAKATLACIYRMLDFMMDLSSHKVLKTREGGVVKTSEAGSTHKCLHSEWGKTAPPASTESKSHVSVHLSHVRLYDGSFLAESPENK